jgi:hypothetical protein
MNAADQARAEAERIVNANAAAANADVTPVVQAPPVAPAAALPLAQVVIDNAALAQLLAACQPQPHVAGAVLLERAGSTGLKAFSSADAVEWMSWKTHYLEVCEINAWPNIRGVREARVAMAKKAARHTANVVLVYVPDVAAIPPVLVTTWQDLIARYQEKFMPAAAGVYSRAEYNIAKQILSEDDGGWHARLRDLYNRAYPSQEVDNNLPLIKKLVTELSNKEVGKFVFLKGTLEFLQEPLRLPKPRRRLTWVSSQLLAVAASILSLIRPKMASTIWVEDAAADEEGAKRAAAALRGEKEKQASAGFVTPPLTNAPSDRMD